MNVIRAAQTVLALLLFTAANPSVQALTLADVASRYSDCSLTDNGNGTSTASVTIDFNPTAGRLSDSIFLSRGLLFNFYDKNGVLQSLHPISGALDGDVSQSFWNKPDYALIHGIGKSWDNEQALRTSATVVVNNRMIADWPAVFIRAANYVVGEDVAEVTGGVYITAASQGVCRLVKEPASPPPFDINITVNAPDWDLGEINPGPQTLPLRASSDRLCLEYRDNDVDAKPFIINATNQNGMADGRFQLKNTEESAQVIPYELILENGSQQVPLPNNRSAPIPLDRGGKTCFSPLFRTFAAKNIHPGDYTDVLTFTIVTPT